jgi:hypothetical protein
VFIASLVSLPLAETPLVWGLCIFTAVCSGLQWVRLAYAIPTKEGQ